MTNYTLLPGLFANYYDLSRLVASGELAQLRAISRHNWRVTANSRLERLIKKRATPPHRRGPFRLIKLYIEGFLNLCEEVCHERINFASPTVFACRSTRQRKYRVQLST